MARSFGRLPHEMGHGMAITYFQTLLNHLSDGVQAQRETVNTDGLLDVDVDALIRKGQRSGFGGQADDG